MKRLARVLTFVVLVGLCFAGSPADILVPGFAIRPYAPCIGMEVQFTDYSAGTPVEWLWEFGDGTTSIFQNPFHTYTTAGDFTITLTVTDASGVSASASKSSIGDR